MYKFSDESNFLDDYIYDEPQIYVGSNGKSEYTNCHAIPKLSERSIILDLDKIDIPEDVRNMSEQIFQQLETNTKRGRRRKKLLFYCIFNAYKELGHPQDPKLIAELVGISATEMTKAFSMCSELQTNYKPSSVFYSPLDYISIEFLEEVGLDEQCLDDILKLGQSILEKDPDLYENYPQVVAAGIILYYMTINGATVNKKEFARVVKRSEMTISKCLKRISQVHNS